MPIFRFPIAVVYLAVILFAIAVCLEIYIYWWRSKNGGIHSEGNPIFLLKKGPYGMVRHPSMLVWTIGFVVLTVAISNIIMFTPLSIIGNIAMILYQHKRAVDEEEFNKKKWGDRYTEYMEKVPRFNFLAGVKLKGEIFK